MEYENDMFYSSTTWDHGNLIKKHVFFPDGDKGKGSLYLTHKI